MRVDEAENDISSAAIRRAGSQAEHDGHFFCRDVSVGVNYNSRARVPSGRRLGKSSPKYFVEAMVGRTIADSLPNETIWLLAPLSIYLLD